VVSRAGGEEVGGVGDGGGTTSGGTASGTPFQSELEPCCEVRRVDGPKEQSLLRNWESDFVPDACAGAAGSASVSKCERGTDRTQGAAV